MALVSDPSLEGFNSFSSVEDADEYFTGVYFGSARKWSDITDVAEKEALLITATRKLNSLPWGGNPFSDEQPLAFPRSFLNPSAEYGYGWVSTGEFGPALPNWLKNATYEMARWIMSEEDRPATDAEFSMLKSMKVGPLNYEFRDGLLGLPPGVSGLLSTLGTHIIDLGTGPRSKRMVL